MLSDWFVASDSQWVAYAMTLLRIGIGACFVVHGLGKLGVVGPGNMEGFTGWLESLGLPFPKLQAQAAMLTEIVGGACLAIGLFSRPACIALIFTMIVAGLIGHKGGGYLITNDPPGSEYVINLILVLILLLAAGPGAYSVDAVIF